MSVHPPKYALAFLRFFCRADYLEEIEGNLTEVFENQSIHSERKARLAFTISVLRHFRPAFIKTFSVHTTSNTTAMFRHNLLTSMRNFKRNKASFIINVLGLSIGLACALMVYLWIADEKNVDHYNEKDAQLYQVLENYTGNTGIGTGIGTQGLLANALATEFPEVEYATTVVPHAWFYSEGVISHDGQKIKARPQFASKDYFNVFTLPLIQGNRNNLFPDSRAVLISEDLAKRLFHTTSDVVGKTIAWNHMINDNYHITGIYANLPPNAQDPFDILFNFDAFIENRPGMKEWGNSDPSTFLLLKQGTDADAFNAKIENFLKTKDPAFKSTLFVQRFSTRYLYGNYENGKIAGGRILYVRILTIIGIFMLLIACINFMNLSTARAATRMKETGVRKSVGASRWALVIQFFSESALITFVSLLIAVGTVYAFLPVFNGISGKHIILSPDTDFINLLLLIFLGTSVLAGSYPALYLSGFNPAAVLKGKMTSSFSELITRKGLVVFQFSISIILILVVWVVSAQMQYIQNRNLGYETDNIVTFGMEGTPIEKLEAFRDELSKIPGVISSGSFGHNLSSDHGNIELSWEGKTPDQHLDFANLEVGFGFVKTMGIEIKEGRNVAESPNWEHETVLNEEAIRFMGLKDPIGKTISFWGETKTIVGVAKNFNFESLYQPIKPAFFRTYPVMFYWMAKIQGGAEATTLEQIHALQQKFAPGYPFEYKFLDENYQALYQSEKRVSVVARYFAVIAVVISCLGLFALSAFTAERRSKEIGIRKVLGSSEAAIVLLLSSDFTRIVCTAIVIALPAGYLIMKYWLDSFAFKTPLSWYYFFGAGVGALIIAWLTIGAHTLRAARLNPVEILKSE